MKGNGKRTEGVQRREVSARGEYKMAWLWVEGWRARLRAGGEVVEECRRAFGENSGFLQRDSWQRNEQ